MFHEVTLVGTIGLEPEMRYTTDGKGFCSVRVAVNQRGAGNQKTTIWFKVTAWEKMGEYVNNYAHKGNKVFVVGRLVCNEAGAPRVYTKQDGTAVSTFEIVAREFQIVDYKNGQNQGQAQYQPRPQAAQQARPQTQQPQSQPQQGEFTDDIPW